MMFATTPAYKAVMATTKRTITPFISLGTDIDSTAADDITAITGDFLAMSNTSQLTDAVYILNNKMATFERKGIETATGLNLAPPISSVVAPPYVGVWSGPMSDSQGVIDWSLTIVLSQAHTSALTLYFGDVWATGGAVEYWVSGVKTSEEVIPSDSGRTLALRRKHTYDKIVIRITRTSVPQTHMRLAEIEFGASIAFTDKEITGTIDLISERDPTGITSPISEITFTLNNIQGLYDEDSPDRTIDRLQPGYPLTYSLTVKTADGDETIPMGRFYIVGREFSDKSVEITAQDIRYSLQTIVPAKAFTTSTSIGAQLDAWFAELDIPHLIPDSLFAISLDQAYTYDGSTDALTIVTHIAQKTAHEFYITRGGIATFSAVSVYSDYGIIPHATIFEHPGATTADDYNVLSVSYGGEIYSVDFRTDVSTPICEISVDNPLINTLAQATALSQRVQAGLSGVKVAWEWLGDPSLDCGDTAKVPTRNVDDVTLSSTSITRIESRYNGIFVSDMEGQQ